MQKLQVAAVKNDVNKSDWLPKKSIVCKRGPTERRPTKLCKPGFLTHAQITENRHSEDFGDNLRQDVERPQLTCGGVAS